MSKLIGRPGAITPDGVPKGWIDRFEKLLEPLEKLPSGKGRPGLASDIMSFVIQGEPATILGEVGKYQGVVEHLRLNGRNAGPEKESLAIYKDFELLPAPVGLRWARLLEACAGQQPRGYVMQFASGVHWPEALFLHASGLGPFFWSNLSPSPRISAAAFESLLIEAGLDAAALLVAAYASPVNAGYRTEVRLEGVAKLPDYANAADRHLDALRPLLTAPLVAQRLHMASMLAALRDDTLVRLASELVELATCGSKQVRAAAEPLIRRCRAAGLPVLAEQAEKGKPEQRVFALRLLYALGTEFSDEAVQHRARELAQADKAPSAQALLDEWDGRNAVEQAAAPNYEYAMPSTDWSGALTPAVSQSLDQFWQAMNDSVDQSNQQSRKWHESQAAQGRPHKLHQQPRFADAELKAIKEYIASSEPRWKGRERERFAWQHATKSLPKFAASAGANPTAVIKLICGLGLLTGHNGQLNPVLATAINALHHVGGRPTLLELSTMLQDIGVAPEAVLQSYCASWGSPLARDWEDAKVWPFFAHHLPLLVSGLTQSQVRNYWFDRGGLFRAVATLPVPPPAVINALFDLALGSAKGERPLAQAALANLPAKELRIINALADGKADVRTVAAQWLGQLRHAPAIPALEVAVAKEKHDVPKGAMLDALQALGQPVEKYLDRTALAKDAARTLSKELPKDLDWFPWSALPAVRWADSKEPVPTDVLRWMLVQSVKQKSPEPNAVLRKYCAMFEPRDREMLGQFLLETWIREDLRPIAPELARQQATQQANMWFNALKNHPKHYENSPYQGRSVDEITAMLLPGQLRLPAGSAIGSKGVLAVAAACAAERAAAPVQRYLKEYYGMRAAQGKALIAMLAWIEHPTATQLMLSIGNRFRTKSFQEEATRQAEALAERKNWTLSELADRTIPSAGFDESGELELSYGERRFTARLLPDFKVELYNADGKKIAALPDPRQDENEELAKDAKKAFSVAKKEIKGIVEQQTDRLYEALCTERDWSFEDWSLYLYRHAVVRRLLQRLVWVQVADGKVVRIFRPLDDGTLTDVEDNEVTLPADARVRVAHDSLLTAEEVARWQQHLIDYQIAPLFQQLGKGTYTLPESKARQDVVEDFEGHLIEAFKLRGRALKLGYMRGPAEDGGWFHVYAKRFPTLGLEAIIEFTGNPLPEENRTVGLISLTFVSSSDQSWQRGRMPLAGVPRVLLSECYNDLRLIAGEGTGFDVEWQKKTQY